MTWSRVHRWLFVVLLTAAGILHIASPDGYERIVPPSLGNPRPWVYASGMAEILVAAAIVPVRTRRLGSLGAIALLIAVFPANVYAALNGGYTSFPAPFNSREAAWVRLPMQALLIWWAYAISRSGTENRDSKSSKRDSQRR